VGNLSGPTSVTNTLSPWSVYVGSRSVHNAFHHDDFTSHSEPGFGPSVAVRNITIPAGQVIRPTRIARRSVAPQDQLLHRSRTGRIWNSWGLPWPQVGVFKTMGHGLIFRGLTPTPKNPKQFGHNHRRPVRELDFFQPVLWDPNWYGLSDTTSHIIWCLVTPICCPPVVGSTPVKGGRWRLADGRYYSLSQTGQPFTPSYRRRIARIQRRDQLSESSYNTGCQSLVQSWDINNYIKIECFAPTKPVVFPRAPFG